MSMDNLKDHPLVGGRVARKSRRRAERVAQIEAADQVMDGLLIATVTREEVDMWQARLDAKSHG